MTDNLFCSPSILHTHSTVILYGAGNAGRDVFHLLAEKGWNIRCFLDRKAKPGDQLLDIPVFQPDNTVLSDQERRLPVVICIFNPDADIPHVATSLVRYGYQNILSFLDFHALFPTEMGDRFWLTERDFYSHHVDEIDAAAALWADDLSKQVYAATLSYRRTGNYQEIDQFIVPSQTQYFPLNIPGWYPEHPFRFVDCGAYDGDTIKVLVDLGKPVQAIAAFEPDLENFSKLALMTGALSPKPDGGIYLWPCGVSNRTGMVAFGAGGGTSSKVDPGGNTFIECVRLDDALYNFRPNLIKMDIEGSEPEATEGAMCNILENLPRLAISVYHAPDHLWRIPLMIADSTKKYTYYLRAHAFNGFDTVLYAVPSSEI